MEHVAADGRLCMCLPHALCSCVWHAVSCQIIWQPTGFKTLQLSARLNRTHSISSTVKLWLQHNLLCQASRQPTAAMLLTLHRPFSLTPNQLRHFRLDTLSVNESRQHHARSEAAVVFPTKHEEEAEVKGYKEEEEAATWELRHSRVCL